MNCGPVARFCAILCTANSRNHPQLEARFPGSVNTTETAVNGERGGSNRPVPNGPVQRHSNVPALVRAPGHLRGNFCTTAPDSERREREIVIGALGHLASAPGSLRFSWRSDRRSTGLMMLWLALFLPVGKRHSVIT